MLAKDSKPTFTMVRCACGKNFKHPRGPGRIPKKCPKCRAKKEK